MTDRDRLINSARPFANSCACEEETGVCEFTDCKTCNATCLADVLIEDGWIRPPCKVGDKVYIISRNKVKECEVVFIGISADEKCSYFNFVENYADGTFYKSYSMVFEVIGKTVFLTKEEAVAKLKECEGNDNNKSY